MALNLDDGAPEKSEVGAGWDFLVTILAGWETMVACGLRVCRGLIDARVRYEDGVCG